MEELFEFDLSDVDVAAFESVVTPAVETHPIEAQAHGQIASLQQETGGQISTQIEESQNNHHQQHHHHNHHHHNHQHDHHHNVDARQDEKQLESLQHESVQCHQQHSGNQMHDKLRPPTPPPPLQQQPTQTIQIQLQQKHQLTTSQQIQLQQQLQNHQITTSTGQQPCKILLIPINSTKTGTSGLKPADCFIPGIKNLVQLPQGASPLTLNTLKTTTVTTTLSNNNSSNTTMSNHHNNVKKHLNQHNSIQLPPPPTQMSHHQSQSITSSPTMIANEVPKRKPCNCTKSQCLKLYCDCFANGEFCSGCNCKDCYNSLSREKERQKAITQCLERNPEAFRPKIGKAIKGASLGEPTPESIERRHTKGCNCKRSGCLKNYCECYEAKILCSNLCKCCGCKNYEESFERKTLMQLANSSTDSARGILKNLLPTNSTKSTNSTSISHNVVTSNNNRQGSSVGTKNFINKEVIHASLGCLLQSAQQAEKDGLPSDEIQDLIQMEMGRCLRMIVNSIANDSTQSSNSKRR